MKSIPYELIGSRPAPYAHQKTDTAFWRKPQSCWKRSGPCTTDLRSRAKLITMQTSTGSIKKASRKDRRVREAETFVSSLDYELKKHLYRDLAKFGEDRKSASAKHSVAETHGFEGVRAREDSPSRTFGSNTKPADGRARSRGPLSWPLATTGLSESSRKSPRWFLDLRPCRRSLEAAQGFWDQRELTAEILSL